VNTRKRLRAAATVGPKHRPRQRGAVNGRADSQPAEDRYSSRVDEPETDVEQPDEEWFDDDVDED
jgi:hypothetical protein